MGLTTGKRPVSLLRPKTQSNSPAVNPPSGGSNVTLQDVMSTVGRLRVGVKIPKPPRGVIGLPGSLLVEESSPAVVKAISSGTLKHQKFQLRSDAEYMFVQKQILDFVDRVMQLAKEEMPEATGEWRAALRQKAFASRLDYCPAHCCTELNEGSDYFPYCSWDCQDWVEQVLRGQEC